jgi:hypothetical protein
MCLWSNHASPEGEGSRASAVHQGGWEVSMLSANPSPFADELRALGPFELGRRRAVRSALLDAGPGAGPDEVAGAAADLLISAVSSPDVIEGCWRDLGGRLDSDEDRADFGRYCWAFCAGLRDLI